MNFRSGRVVSIRHSEMLLLLCSLGAVLHSKLVIAQETHTKCISTFTSYTSSPFEKLWSENIENWQNSECEHITQPEIAWWIGNATSSFADNAESAVVSDSAVPPHKSWAWMFPVFTYKKLCVHKTDGNIMTEFVHIPIEPTAALVRDPRKVSVPVCLCSSVHCSDGRPLRCSARSPRTKLSCTRRSTSCLLPTTRVQSVP
jgi:hypothetical protein